MTELTIGNPFHVYPLNDFRPHEVDGKSCWCNPTVDQDGVIVHNSMDRREEYEEGRKMS